MDVEKTDKVMKMYTNCQIGTYTNYKLGFTVRKKIMESLYWFHDRLRKQQTIFVADFDATVLTRALSDCKVEGYNKVKEVKNDVGPIKFKMEWWKWKE